MIQLPSEKELAAELYRLSLEVEDDFRSSDDDDDENPSMQVTLGAGEGGYALQTGDNSFTGAAYGFPLWGVHSVWLGMDEEDALGVAREMLDEIADQVDDLAAAQSLSQVAPLGGDG